MIEIALLLGAVGLVLATFWDDIVNWLQKAVAAVKRVIQGILHGAKVFIKKAGEAFKEIAKYYSKNGTQWTETTKTRTVDESEVPEEIRMRAERTNELDITDELEMQLA